MIDFDEERLSYDLETGLVTKTITMGGLSAEGYICIKIKGKTHKLHRVIWEHIYGKIPKGRQIDHINGIRSDNRLENLRLATAKQQAQNRKVRSDSVSGASGVSFSKQHHKWKASISVNGVKVHLGYFDCIEEAKKVREMAKNQYHTFNPVQR